MDTKRVKFLPGEFFVYVNGSHQQILIREYLTDEELYRGKVNEVPVDLWHRPMESFRILVDGCRLVEVG